jgi:hypothetical protein
MIVTNLVSWFSTTSLATTLVRAWASAKALAAPASALAKAATALAKAAATVAGRAGAAHPAFCSRPLEYPLNHNNSKIRKQYAQYVLAHD